MTEVMELCYVTERIIALWYREDAQGVLEHATALLRGKHGDNYMVSGELMAVDSWSRSFFLLNNNPPLDKNCYEVIGLQHYQ